VVAQANHQITKCSRK